MHLSAVLFSLWGMPLLFLFFSNIYTISVCLKLPPVLYSSPHDIFFIHTFHTPHIILSSPLYTTPILTGMSYLECLLHSAPVLFVVERTPDFSFTSFAVPFVAWPYVLPRPPLTVKTLNLTVEYTFQLEAYI